MIGPAGQAAAAGPHATAGLAATAGPDAMVDLDTLRELVREVLREVLPAIAGQPNLLNAISNVSQPVERHIERVAGGGPRPAARRIEPAAGGSLGPAAGSAAGGPAGTVRAVRLASDEELHAFVAEVLRLADDPRQRHDLLSGRLRFTLASPAGGRKPGPAGPGPDGAGRYQAEVTARYTAARRGGRAGARPAGLGQHGVRPAGSGHDYAGTAATWPAGPAGPAPTVRRIEKGAVTERAVLAAAKAGERLVLGPRAVLTPLARDKARALGVPVQKER